MNNFNLAHNNKGNYVLRVVLLLELTCSRSLSSANIAALCQLITSAKGNSHPLASSTGTQPACSTSRNLNEPRRRPLGTKQKEELRSSTS